MQDYKKGLGFMRYFYSIEDENNCVHSIDNVIFIYYLRNTNMKKVAEELIAIREKNHCDGWERLDCKPCNKYSWYQNIVHFQNSIHISFGKYGDYDQTRHTYMLFSMLRLEVNPNKHSEEPIFRDILSWLKRNCTSGELKKFDYAIDVPYPISSIRIYNSRKEPGLYKGTIYRGQRSQHGFLKIYDKAKETGEEGSLTRIEYTLDAGKKPSLENIAVRLEDTGDCKTMLQIESEGDSDTKGTKQEQRTVNVCIAGLALDLEGLGGNYQPYLKKLNYRRRKQLEPLLTRGTLMVKKDEQILADLIEHINRLFDADQPEETDGFVLIGDNVSELPF